MPPAADVWIRRLALVPHPEGGWYRETYRSPVTLDRRALPGGHASDPPVATSIYFLLTSDTFSALHRIRSDETWHFYDGDSLDVHQIDEAGGHEILRLGRGENEHLQGIVPAGRWFGARTSQGGSWSLVGCTVAPGFLFEDFEMARREELSARHPAHATLIESLTRVE